MGGYKEMCLESESHFECHLCRNDDLVELV